MTPERWETVKRLFHDALEREPQARESFLADVEWNDPAAAKEVRALLRATPAADAAFEAATAAAAPKTLAGGTRLGPYEVLGLLAAGGMGEVYKARDIRLDRTVAIKVMPPQIASDRDQRKRFEREARTISRLNHPHICAVYDVGEQDGRAFLVMEYLEGEDLAGRLSRGPLPVSEALQHAGEILRALVEAHSRGIVHRDLKPANVMLTRSGAKLLDFGIAKLYQERTAAESAATGSTDSLTGSGVIVGTPQYMSPEQLKGEPVGVATDVFAFGVVLYEMVTGRKAFEAPSRAGLIAAILEREPPLLSHAQPLSPPWLDVVVKRCLAKSPEDRWPSSADVLAQLERRALAGRGAERAGERWRRLPRRRRVALGTVVAGIALLAAAAAAVRLRDRMQTVPGHGPVLKRLTADAGLSTYPALSRDGRLIAFASDRAGEGQLDIWVQQVAGGEPIRLTRHAADEAMPDFAPDGTQIAFRSDRDGGGIYVVSALGGEARLIARDAYNPRFSPDGRSIAYHTGIPGARGAGILRFGAGKLYIVPTTGGPPRQIQPSAKAAGLGIWAPDSQHLLMLASFETGIEPGEWWVTPLEGPATQVSRQPLTQLGLRGAYPTVWLPGNRVVFSASLGDSRNSWMATLSPEDWQVEGPVRRLTSGAGIEGATSVGSPAPGILRLAFSNVAENVDLWSIPLRREGLQQTAGPPVRLTQDAFVDIHPAVTPDGKTVVYASARGVTELWARDLATGRETKQVSMSPDPVMKPVLSADGTKLAFWRLENEGRPSATFVADLTTASDGTLVAGAPRQLPALAREGSGWPWSWSPDGRRVWYDTARWPKLAPNHLYDLATGRPEAELLHPDHDLAFVLPSPDGRWLVFFEPLSDNVARLVAAPVKDGKPAGERDWIPVTAGDSGVFWHAWSPSGDVIYFTSARDGFVCVWAQRVARESMRPLGPPAAVYHAHTARLSIGSVGPNLRGMAAAHDKVVFNMSEAAGNIWMAEVEDGR